MKKKLGALKKKNNWPSCALIFARFLNCCPRPFSPNPFQKKRHQAAAASRNRRFTGLGNFHKDIFIETFFLALWVKNWLSWMHSLYSLTIASQHGLERGGGLWPMAVFLSMIYKSQKIAFPCFWEWNWFLPTQPPVRTIFFCPLPWAFTFSSAFFSGFNCL